MPSLNPLRLITRSHTPRPAPVGEHTQQRDIIARTLTLRAESVNEADRSIEAVVATEGVVLVFDMRRFEVIDEVLRAEGGEFAERLPMLNNHFRFSLDDVLGSVRGARQNGKTWTARLYFTEGDEDAERAWNKARQGHLTDVSVGYRAIEFTDIEPGQTKTVNGRSYTAKERVLRITTKWQAREVSLVPIGADPAAKMREQPGNAARPVQSETTMPDANTNTPDAADDRLGLNRIRAIRELAGEDVPPALLNRAIDEGWDEQRAAREFLDAVRSSRRQTGIGLAGSPRPGSTPAILGTALLLRAGIDPTKRAGLHDDDRREAERLANAAEPYAARSLPALMEDFLRMEGRPLHADWRENVRAAVSSANIQAAFSTSVNAALMQRWERTEDSTRGWVLERPVNDFKLNERIGLGKTGSLTKLPRGGEADHDSIADAPAETYRIHRFARQFSIDEQDVADDRLDWLSLVPIEMADAAKRVKLDLVYALLLENPTLKADSTAVFHADHGNAGTDALAADALKAAVTAIRTQTQDGVSLNITPRHLIVAPTLEWTARELIQSAQILIDGNSAAVERGNRNTLADVGLTLHVEPRLENGVTSPATEIAYSGAATKWFLASDPIRTIEVGYLGGRMAPTLRSYQLTQGRWGVGFDIKMDVGAVVLGYRGLHRGNS